MKVSETASDFSSEPSDPSVVDLPGTLFLIDAPIYFFRAYFGLPDRFRDPRGRSVQGIFGFAAFLLEFLQRVRPECCAITFDESPQSCFRFKLWPAYKSNRAVAVENIRYRFAQCKKLARALGIKTLASRRYESDDLIGTLANRSRREVVILSRDKDLAQLTGRLESCLNVRAQEITGRE